MIWHDYARILSLSLTDNTKLAQRGHHQMRTLSLEVIFGFFFFFLFPV